MSRRHFPFAALAPYVNARWQPPTVYMATTSDIGKTADVLQLPRRTIQRWRTDGLTEEAADIAATRLGLHPATIWPDWLDGAEWEPTELLKADRRSAKTQPELEPCGTYAAWRRHKRDGERPCSDCRNAARVYGQADHRRMMQDPERATAARERWARKALARRLRLVEAPAQSTEIEHACDTLTGDIDDPGDACNAPGSDATYVEVP